MTRKRQAQDLMYLTELVFSKSAADVQRLSNQQNLMRQELEQLQEEEERAQQMFCEDLLLRMSQTDVLWQSWLGRQRRAVNTELARISAEKEKQLSGLREAFGRKEVAARIARDFGKR